MKYISAFFVSGGCMRIQNTTTYPNITRFNQQKINISSTPKNFLGDDDDDDKKLSKEQKLALGAKLAVVAAVGVGVGLLIANRNKIINLIRERFSNNAVQTEPTIKGLLEGPKDKAIEVVKTTEETVVPEVVEVVEVISNNVKKVQQPEYFYHITSESAYKSIMKDCFLKKSSIEDGVFLSDLKSLEKYPEEELKNMAQWYAGAYEGVPFAHPKGNKIYVFKFPAEAIKERLDFRQISLMSSPVRGANPFIEFPMYGAAETSSLIEKPLEFLHRGEIPVSFSNKIIEIRVKDISNPNFKELLLQKLK